MKNMIKSLKLKNIYLFLLLLVFIVSGCVEPKIATDLLTTASPNKQPLTNNSSIINVTINPKINNYEKLDESVKESLEIAFANANIFGADSSSAYRINSNILIASQAPMSFGSFKGKLEIRYVVNEPNGKEILDKTIFTVAGSDKFIFSGGARHRRARAVNISKNVLQFVDILQNLLQK